MYRGSFCSPPPHLPFPLLLLVVGVDAAVSIWAVPKQEINKVKTATAAFDRYQDAACRFATLDISPFLSSLTRIL